MPVRARRAAARATTGERPVEGATPDSLLAFHAAGYREVRRKVGPGVVLDAGCGLGFETARLVGSDRLVLALDYDVGTAQSVARRWRGSGVEAVAGDAARMGLKARSVDWVCSSHIVEHFDDPDPHVSELARVLKADGTALVITPNAPADFENPYHVHPFVPAELGAMCRRHFDDVRLVGLDATPRVKADFTARRVKAEKLLRLDVLDLRHRVPHRWYVGAYTRLLPLAYRLVARGDSGGLTGITADDFFLTDDVDETTLALFATCRRPRH